METPGEIDSVRRVRLVAVDMDGTFLDADSRYDRDRFGQVHRRLVAQGVRFVVASGNQYWQLRSYFEGFDDVLFVAENGAVIASTDEPLRITPMQPDAAASALRVVDALPGVFVLPCAYRAAFARRDSDPEVLGLLRHYYHRLELVDDWGEIDPGVVKFALACEPGQTAALVDHLTAELPGSVVPVSSGHGSIDLISRGVNKGVALAWLGERLGVRPAEMVAFGDGGNDVEMLRLVGLGVAMANAPDEIKLHADAVTGGHHEHGVLAFLEDLLDRTERDQDTPRDW